MIYRVMLLITFGGMIFISVVLSFVFHNSIAGAVTPLVFTYTGIIILIFLGCWFFSGWLTEKIIKPLNEFDPEKDYSFYDELTPFIRHVREQRIRLDEQFTEIVRDKALLNALSKSMSEGLILVDRESRIQSINQSALAILDIDESGIGKNILEAIRRADILDHLNLALSGQNNELIFEISSKTYQIIFSPVENGALMLLLDITEKAEAEKLRREFSANVSHELKTPLTVISGYAELVENGMVKSEDIIGIAAKIKNESSRLLTLIEDIIKLSRLDESNSTKDFTEFDLTVIVREVAASLSQRAADADVNLNLPDKPMLISANRDMLFEMFYNLLDNGIKYNKPDGKITVLLSKSHDHIHVSVADTGIGIEKKHLSRIFERFYRVDASRSKETGGTGLGLSIVKHIVAFHNGTISVESKPGIGTTIRITLAA